MAEEVCVKHVTDLPKCKQLPLPGEFFVVVTDPTTRMSCKVTIEELGIQNPESVTTLTISQTDHGFIMPNEGVIMAYVDPVDGKVKKAYSATTNTLSQFAIVDVIDKDTIKIRRHGPIVTTNNHGLTVGKMYYLHPNIPGGVTDVVPVAPNYKKQVLYVVSTNSYFLVDQPEEL
jgi:hypothetical protein